MQTISLLEYEKLPRSRIPVRALRELQSFDEQQARFSKDTIFDWNLLHFIRAKNYVGVILVSDLTIEVLPKIDIRQENEVEGPDVQQTCRQNLLYMLSQVKRIPIQERDLASQKLQKLPMLEVLIRIFARKLLTELRRGQQHLYSYREEELPYVKGKLIMKRLGQRNVSRSHLLPVGFDEFVNDTWLNRVLKAACNRLLKMSVTTTTEQYLKEALLELSDVVQCEIATHDFESVVLDRNATRFQELFELSKLVLQGTSPSAAYGQNKTFNLLVPMEVLFEEFIGATFKTHACQFGFSRDQIHVQASRRTKTLLRDESGKGTFRLKPDVLFEDASGNPSIILDTKWKRLRPDAQNRKNGVSQSDMYQLYAYANRYRCPNNILLYPSSEGVTGNRYQLDGTTDGTCICVAVVDLSYNLRKNKGQFINRLQEILHTVNKQRRQNY